MTRRCNVFFLAVVKRVMRPSYFPLLLLLALPSCKKDASSTKRLKVALEECAPKTKEVDDLRLCFDAVLEDSRCPVNADCVWQGVAIARFTLLLNGQEHQLELATNNEQPGTHTDTTLQQYTFSLRNLQPDPGTTATEKPFAEVDIKKR